MRSFEILQFDFLMRKIRIFNVCWKTRLVHVSHLIFILSLACDKNVAHSIAKAGDPRADITRDIFDR